MSDKSRKKVNLFGVGTNDADYPTSPKKEGVKAICPYYQCWAEMLRRCYSKNALIRQPTYKGCAVVEEWHSFMTFRAWMMKQDWEGLQLDKDILVPGNKVYGPETCCFVTPQVNTILNVRNAKNGLPQGVSLNKRTGRYRAQCMINGSVYRYIGSYETVEEASQAYLYHKKRAVISVALTQPNNVFKGMMRHIAAMEKAYA